MESMKEGEVVINIDNSSSSGGMEEMKEEMSSGGGGKVRKERRMSSGKKPPRPPCRGLSLDAADQKLIKEISDLLIIKRAKIQRIKKSKAAAAASAAPPKGTSSSSTTGNLIALLFTLVFCLLIIFQGWQPGDSSRGVGIVSPKAEGGDQNLEASSSSSMLYQVIGSSPNSLVGGKGEGEGGRDIH